MVAWRVIGRSAASSLRLSEPPVRRRSRSSRRVGSAIASNGVCIAADYATFRLHVKGLAPTPPYDPAVLLAADPGMSPRRRAALVAAIAVGAVAVSTVLVAVAESPPLSVPNAAPLFLLAVVVAGLGGGTLAAVLTAVASFVVYDLFFVEPHFTLFVEDPGEWLNLLLLLIVGLVIGRLTAQQGERAADAARRARENAALFGISRTLATAEHTESALQAIVDQLVAETGDGARLGVDRRRSGRTRRGRLGDGSAATRASRIQTVLRRTPGDQPAVWVRAHEPGRTARPVLDRPPDGDLYRVAIVADGRVLGWLVAIRPTDADASRLARRRASWPLPRTRSGWRSRASGSPRRRGRAPRSPARATRSRPRSSSRCRTTCARRSPASARRRAA